MCDGWRVTHVWRVTFMNVQYVPWRYVMCGIPHTHIPSRYIHVHVRRYVYVCTWMYTFRKRKEPSSKEGDDEMTHTFIWGEPGQAASWRLQGTSLKSIQFHRQNLCWWKYHHMLVWLWRRSTESGNRHHRFPCCKLKKWNVLKHRCCWSRTDAVCRNQRSRHLPDRTRHWQTPWILRHLCW